jgi:hypothetical protein
MAEVDLRPMTLGEVLDRTFKLYKNHFWLFAGISAIPSGILLLLHVANSALVGYQATAGRSPGSPAPIPSTAIATGLAVGAALGIAYLALWSYGQAATVFAVSDLYLGSGASIRESYKRVGAKALRVFFIFFLTLIVCVVGFLLFIIPGIILGCRAAISVPVAMLEDTRSVRSIERSMQLTKGHTIEVFVILLMVGAMSYMVTMLLQIPFFVAIIMAAAAHHTPSFGILLLSNVASFIGQVLIGPIGTIALSLMYYNLRVRKEAFDIQHLMAKLGPNPTLGTPSTV